MYCIQCGVKLADSEKKCPLCGIRVYHPDLEQPKGEKLYPKNRYPDDRSTLLAQAIVSVLFLLPMLVTPLCDIHFSGGITWSGYVIGALLLCYVVAVLPSWFKRPNPVIFVPCDFAAVALFLHYVNFMVDGSWFWSFALPLVGTLCAIVTAVVTLRRYVKGGRLYVFGGALMALGASMLLMEFLINFTFDIEKFFGWSLYPLIVLALMGGLLIFLAICSPARDNVKRKTFW